MQQILNRRDSTRVEVRAQELYMDQRVRNYCNQLDEHGQRSKNKQKQLINRGGKVNGKINIVEVMEWEVDQEMREWS